MAAGTTTTTTEYRKDVQRGEKFVIFEWKDSAHLNARREIIVALYAMRCEAYF